MCVLAYALSTRGNIRFLRYERRKRGRERRKGGKIVRPLVPATVFTSYCSLPDSTGIVPLLSLFPSFLFPPYSFEVYTGCLEMSGILRAKNTCMGKCAT